MAAWPAGIPQKPLYGTLQTTPEDVRGVFQPDIGPPIIWLVASTAGENLSFSISLTDAEYTTFLDWWNDTISHGADSFTWAHPLTGATETFRFTAPPKISNRSTGAHIVQIKLYQEP